MKIEDNMKMYFERKVNSVDRNIDVKNNVMNEIGNPKRLTSNKRVLAFALVFAVFMASTGIVYGQEIVTQIKNMDFFNSKGEVEWSITTEEDDNGINNKSAFEVFDSLEIEEGKAVAIYVVENNPDNSIVSMQQPITNKEFQHVNSYLVGVDNIILDNEILEKYHFNNSYINYELPNININEMIKEASVEKKGVVVKDIEVTDRIMSIAYEYSDYDNQRSFIVEVTNCIGNNVKKIIDAQEESEVLLDYDKLMIGSSEILYEHIEDMQQLTWISNGYYYSIISTQSTMTKDELIKIVEEIKVK